MEHSRSPRRNLASRHCVPPRCRSAGGRQDAETPRRGWLHPPARCRGVFPSGTGSALAEKSRLRHQLVECLFAPLASALKRPESTPKASNAMSVRRPSKRSSNFCGSRNGHDASNRGHLWNAASVQTSTPSRNRVAPGIKWLLSRRPMGFAGRHGELR